MASEQSENVSESEYEQDSRALAESPCKLSSFLPFDMQNTTTSETRVVEFVNKKWGMFINWLDKHFEEYFGTDSDN